MYVQYEGPTSINHVYFLTKTPLIHQVSPSPFITPVSATDDFLYTNLALAFTCMKMQNRVLWPCIYSIFYRLVPNIYVHGQILIMLT